VSSNRSNCLAHFSALVANSNVAEDKGAKLMSTGGYDATEEEVQEVLQAMDDEVQAIAEEAT
jgi:hypothetical protein